MCGNALRQRNFSRGWDLKPGEATAAWMVGISPFGLNFDCENVEAPRSFQVETQAWSFHNPSAEVEAGEKMEAVFRARDQMSSLVGARVGFRVWGDVPQSEAAQRLRRVGGRNARGWHQACEGIDSRSQGRRSCLETRLRKRRNQGKRGKGFLSSALRTPARLRNRIWGPIKSSSLISAVRT